MISRILNKRITAKVGSGKAIILVGPRQVGKTTLIKDLLANANHLFLDGDDPHTRKVLDSPSFETIQRIVGQNKILFIDEGQRITDIGLTLKMIIDRMPEVQIWVSGSSSFSLFNQLNEPLTGRKWQYQLYPICWEEYESHVGFLKADAALETRLLYGMYPEVINNRSNEIETLQNLVSSYLYKDILAFKRIRKTETLENLVQALALQIGSEINYNEISQLIGVDRNTVISYIDILEQAFVIFKLRSFSRNARNEIKKGRKIYFYDTGIRNCIIGNFQELSIRNDKGALWENFLIAERKKQNDYKFRLAKTYFWRSTQQQEIDYVEVVADQMHAYEFKWRHASKAKISKTFLRNYNATEHVVTTKNFREFVIME